VRGYGVHFDTSSANNRTAVFFADFNNDRLFQPSEVVNTEPVSPGSAVSVSAVTPVMSGTMLDIVFVPPRATVFINGVRTDAAATVTMLHNQTNQSRRATINRISGQINAE
jgi:hypothetical protein